MKPFSAINDLVGKEFLVTDWLPITQERVNTFAEATGDHQWLHTDVERAKRESPYGGTIAHGLLTLSLLPSFTVPYFRDYGVGRAINYGYEKVRFAAPVLVGSRLRARYVLKEAAKIPDGGLRLNTVVTVEADNQSKPVCIAETVSLVFPTKA
ncbi:MAG: dehydratase [Proteobacteria bacterium]|jgi:acyl dehydratase|nr:MAG: dehydratase [Pseudomonadota bacterium]